MFLNMPRQRVFDFDVPTLCWISTTEARPSSLHSLQVEVVDGRHDLGKQGEVLRMIPEKLQVIVKGVREVHYVEMIASCFVLLHQNTWQ
jgi:hypothetical protein